MVVDKKEKLQKVIEQIAKENEIIARARANIRKLNTQKKKLEKAIKDDEFAQICRSLEESGITSVEDFNRIFPNAAISQNPKNGEDSSLDPIL